MLKPSAPRSADLLKEMAKTCTDTDFGRGANLFCSEYADDVKIMRKSRYVI